MFYLMTVGGIAEYHELPVGAEMPVGAVEVPRLPGVGEYWDAAIGDFILDPVVKVDSETPLAHVSEVHLLKLVEAVLIKFGGIDLTGGLLHGEAQLRSLTLLQMANKVLLKAKPLVDREIARMAIKSAAGNGEG